MKAKRLLFLVMAICLANGVKAQFYDSADDIQYYVTFENGKVKDTGWAVVFNFDGRKACVDMTSIEKIKTNLRKSASFYEDWIENAEYRVEYISNNTYQTKGLFAGEYYKFTFSNDRQTLTLVDHCKVAVMNYTPYGPVLSGREEWKDKTYTLKKVDKSYFRVGRSRNPSGTMYE